MAEFKTYEEAKTFALEQAMKLDIAHGIEKPTAYSGWTVKMLPLPQNRFGFELRCEAVEPPSFYRSKAK